MSDAPLQRMDSTPGLDPNLNALATTLTAAIQARTRADEQEAAAELAKARLEVGLSRFIFSCSFGLLALILILAFVAFVMGERGLLSHAFTGAMSFLAGVSAGTFVKKKE